MLAEKNRSLSNSLKKKFLFNNDINSIHLLINLYEIDDNIGEIFPQYLSMATLKKFVKSVLRGRPGKDLATKNISEMIHNDINRFELLVYLEAYKSGYSSYKYVNKIEEIVLSSCNIKAMYSKSYIREMLNSNTDITAVRNELMSYIKKDISSNTNFAKLVGLYNTRILRPKIYNINKYLDKQVKMAQGEDGKAVLKFESKPFTRNELSRLYRKISKIVFDNLIRVMADAYWSGIIEKVLRRYR